MVWGMRSGFLPTAFRHKKLKGSSTDGKDRIEKPDNCGQLFRPGVNSIKKYKCTLQVRPLFLQIHTNLNPLKVFTSSR